MAKRLSLLVDTDIFIDYFNHRVFRDFFEDRAFGIYYSVVTKKELLSKKGLTLAERKNIISFLKKYRLIPLNREILKKYSEHRQKHPSAGKEDCLIAATAVVKKFPLVTRNYRHYRIFRDLKLYFDQLVKDRPFFGMSKKNRKSVSDQMKSLRGHRI
ncbi:MAG: PIN domain-containing protein [Deltaproteobacteria bacterium]|nr:PIN domain-containing protein [Deltaproteobacteria bacterium]